MQGNPFYTVTTKRGLKKEKATFDVSMGAYDEAEVCELIGIFVLYT